MSITVLQPALWDPWKDLYNPKLIPWSILMDYTLNQKIITEKGCKKQNFLYHPSPKITNKAIGDPTYLSMWQATNITELVPMKHNTVGT